MSFDDGYSYTVHLKDLDMPNIVFDHPDPSVFTRLDRLGMEVTDQRIDPAHSVSACRITGDDWQCRRAGAWARLAAGCVGVWYTSIKSWRCTVH